MRNLIVSSLTLSLAVAGNACKNKTSSHPVKNSSPESPGSTQADGSGVPIAVVPPRNPGPVPSDKPMPDAMKLRLNELRAQAETSAELLKRLESVYNGIGDIAFESGIKTLDSSDLTTKIVELQAQSQAAAKSLAEFEGTYRVDPDMAAHLDEFKKSTDTLQSRAATALETQSKVLFGLVIRIERKGSESQQLLERLAQKSALPETTSGELKDIFHKVEIAIKTALGEIESVNKYAVGESMATVRDKIALIKGLENEKSGALLKYADEIPRKEAAENKALTPELIGLKKEFNETNDSFQSTVKMLDSSVLAAKDTNATDRAQKLTQFVDGLKTLKGLLDSQKAIQKKMADSGLDIPASRSEQFETLLEFVYDSIVANSVQLADFQRNLKEVPEKWAEKVNPTIDQSRRMVNETIATLKALDEGIEISSIETKLVQLDTLITKVNAESLRQMSENFKPLRAYFTADEPIFAKAENEVNGILADIGSITPLVEKAKSQIYTLYSGQLGGLTERVAKLTQAMKATQSETLFTDAIVMSTQAQTIEQEYSDVVKPTNTVTKFLSDATKEQQLAKLKDELTQKMHDLKSANETFQKLLKSGSLKITTESLSFLMKEFDTRIEAARKNVNQRAANIYVEMGRDKSIYNLIQQARYVQTALDMLQAQGSDISLQQVAFNNKKDGARSAAFLGFNAWCDDFQNLPESGKSTVKVLMGIALPATKNSEFSIDNCKTSRRYIDSFSTIALSNYGISDITVLGSLSNPKDIYLNNNNIADITPLEFSYRIEILALSKNLLSDSTGTLLSLRSLKRVYLTDNKNISDISSLRNAFKLQFLGLSGNSISDVLPLSQLTNLQMLGLTENKIQDVSPLKNLKNLTALYLGSNQIKNPASLSDLKEKLVELDLRKNPLESQDCPLSRNFYCKLK